MRQERRSTLPPGPAAAVSRWSGCPPRPGCVRSAPGSSYWATFSPIAEGRRSRLVPDPRPSATAEGHQGATPLLNHSVGERGPAWAPQCMLPSHGTQASGPGEDGRSQRGSSCFATMLRHGPHEGAVPGRLEKGDEKAVSGNFEETLQTRLSGLNTF